MEHTPIDTVLRLVAVGEMLVVALVVACSGAFPAIRRGTAVLLTGVIGYLVHSALGFDSAGTPVGFVVLTVATATPLALWLFAHALFERRPDRRVAVAAAVLLLASIIAPAAGGWCTLFEPWLDRAGHTIMALLVLDSLRVALRSRADDLSEKRRRFALTFVGLVGVEALVVVLGEAWFGFDHIPVALRLTEAVLILVAGLIVGGTLLDADLALIGAPVPPVDGPAQPEADGLSPAERVLSDRLDEAMAAGVWQNPGLGIGDLALHLGVPEHRLRALINQKLGYRNFSAFLNTRRIAEAKALLASSDHVALPVLTIAMDLGYGSLAPFNRAFREATGQTPTDFRRAAFAGNKKI
ncbi:helix-turn-helix domain-containing protein [Novosphingobium sp.]|uniref:helix-turn-helix domain-containing protein n=1 Tax=Novosphingobium sp. TaxID=1874826 RepID=UPI003340ABFB